MRLASVEDNGDLWLIKDGKIDVGNTETLIVRVENSRAIWRWKEFTVWTLDI